MPSQRRLLDGDHGADFLIYKCCYSKRIARLIIQPLIEDGNPSVTFLSVSYKVADLHRQPGARTN